MNTLLDANENWITCTSYTSNGAISNKATRKISYSSYHRLIVIVAISPFSAAFTHRQHLIRRLILLQQKLKTMTTKKTNIIYWICTSLFAFFMFGSAIPDIISHPIAVEGMHKGLGYPVYFIPFIGVAKALGVIAILIPGFVRLKEWAYAGLMFDLIGALYSMIAIGIPAADWMPVFLPLALGVASYVLFRKRTARKTVEQNVAHAQFA
jgi:hypothetical protein